MFRRVPVPLAVLLLVLTALPPGAGAHAEYLPPVVVGGKVFPIARTDWYSVINFRNDWHVPRMRFYDGKWRQDGSHEGTDIFAEPGTPIMSITPGRVENLGWQFYSGWRVGVRGDDGRYWFYAHMQRFAPQLAIGQRVQTGALLGAVGNTGYSDVEGHADEFAHHLHLGIQEPAGNWANPYPLVRTLYRAATRS